MGVLNQKHTHAYRVGRLVKNVAILDVRTFWMIPREGSVWQKGTVAITIIDNIVTVFIVILLAPEKVAEY